MNRYRQDNDTPESSTVSFDAVGRDGNAFSGTEGTFTYSRSRKAISDVLTPNFHSRIRRGDIINNAATITASDNPVPGGNYAYDVKYDNGEVGVINATGPMYDNAVGKWLPGPSFAPDPSNGLDLGAMAKLKALSNIDSTPYSFAEDLAEIRTTVRHLISRGKLLKELNTSFDKRIRRFKRLSRGKKASTVARETSQLWLEYRFAISPLVRSIADLMEAANEKLKSRPERLTSRGFEQWSDSSSQTVPYGGSRNLRANRTHESSIKVGAGVLYSVSNPLSGFRFKYGLRNKDIPVTVWAIVPYSFMVDRVFNISQALRAITNLWDPDVHIHAAWCRTSRETRTVYNVNGSAVGSDSNNPQQWHFSGTDLPIESFEYVRVPWTPSIADAIPTPTWVKLVDSFTKIADITALAHVNVKMGR